MNRKKISLVGYMGSGKTAVGKRLADDLQLDFIDLDDAIETLAQKSINQIFQEEGEIAFRKMENQILNSILDDNQSIVLATGGGTPVFYNNMDLLNQHSATFFLQASPTTLAERLSPEKEQRPLISHLKNEDLEEFIAKHLFERNSFYLQAENVVSVNNKKVEEIAKEIIRHLPQSPQ